TSSFGASSTTVLQAPNSQVQTAYYQGGQVQTSQISLGGTLISTDSYSIDGLGRTSQITDSLATGAGALAWWPHGSIDKAQKTAVFTSNADGQMATIQRYTGENANGAPQGFTQFNYRADGLVTNENHRVSSDPNSAQFARFATDYAPLGYKIADQSM